MPEKGSIKKKTEGKVEAQNFDAHVSEEKIFVN